MNIDIEPVRRAVMRVVKRWDMGPEAAAAVIDAVSRGLAASQGVSEVETPEHEHSMGQPKYLRAAPDTWDDSVPPGGQGVRQDPRRPPRRPRRRGGASVTPAARRNARRVLGVLTRLLDQKRDADFVRGVATLVRVSGAMTPGAVAIDTFTKKVAAAERTVPRRPYVSVPWTGTSEPATAGGITGEWLIPATIRRPGVVVTVPGGPLPRPQFHTLLDFGRAVVAQLGVPVLLWDYDAYDPPQGQADITVGIGLAWGRYGAPAVLVSHSFGGVPAAANALGWHGIADAYVAVSSTLDARDLGVDPLGINWPQLYLGAGVDPREFRRKIPVSVIAGGADGTGHAGPAGARSFVEAYRRYGGDARLTVIEGAGHTDTLLDLATLEEIGRCLHG